MMITPDRPKSDLKQRDVDPRSIIHNKYAPETRVKAEPVGIKSLFNNAGGGFSLSLGPLLLEEIPGNARAGCLVTTHLSEKQSVCNNKEINICDRIRISWRGTWHGLSESGKNHLLQDIKHLVTSRTDNILEIIGACKKLKASASSIAGADEASWLFPASIRCSLRKYAFLRRLAMPMHHVRIYDGATTTLATLDVSLLNLLLDLPDVADSVAQMVDQRRFEIQEAFRHAELTGAQPVSRRLRQLHRLLTAALERSGFSRRPTLSTKVQVESETFLVPERFMADQNVRAVREECHRLLSDLEERRKSAEAEICHYTIGGDIKLPYQIRNGTLLVTERELSCEEFFRQKRIMEIVNKKLKRPFYPGTSRPRMQKANLSVEAISRLRSIFFDDGGRLRKSIICDIDKTPRHGYITFANSTCRDMRNDYRWQVPLQRHDTDHLVATRSMVDSLLIEEGIVNPEQERIHDMGILIGGTEDQSIHHDIPRQTTSWLPQDPATSDEDQFVEPLVGGWEYDRVAYNEAMASPFAPCSVLIGLGGNSTARIGVQKNQIDRTGCQEGWCRIVDGKESEAFQIVRENHHLVVVEASPGLLFTGDFQHAGVRNFPKKSAEDKIMLEFFDLVEGIAEATKDHEGDEAPEVIEDVISMMCSFENLDKICRFHCSTEPIRSLLRIPRNTVGFVDCFPNPPTD